MASPDPPGRLREASGADLELVLERRLRFLAEHRGMAVADFDPEFVEATRAFLTRTHPHTFLSWLAEIDGQCVGIVSVVLSDAPPRPEEFRDTDGYIVNMHVDAEHRGKGIGRLLADRALADGEDRGVRRFALHATEDGRPLYESVGFSEEPGWMNRYRAR